MVTLLPGIQGGLFKRNEGTGRSITWLDNIAICVHQMIISLARRSVEKKKKTAPNLTQRILSWGLRIGGGRVTCSLLANKKKYSRPLIYEIC